METGFKTEGREIETRGTNRKDQEQNNNGRKRKPKISFSHRNQVKN